MAMPKETHLVSSHAAPPMRATPISMTNAVVAAVSVLPREGMIVGSLVVVLSKAQTVPFLFAC